MKIAVKLIIITRHASISQEMRKEKGQKELHWRRSINVDLQKSHKVPVLDSTDLMKIYSFLLKQKLKSPAVPTEPTLKVPLTVLTAMKKFHQSESTY